MRRRWARGALVLLLAPLSGCGGGGGAPPPDAGPDAPRGCSGTWLCDGQILRACVDQSPGDVIKNCGLMEGACSLNRCTSPACADVEREATGFAGCLFYTAEADNVASDANAATSFLVTNPGAEVAGVELERHVGGSWTSAGTPAMVAPGAAARLTIAGLAITDSGPNDGGLRVKSSQPVTVAQIQSDSRDNDALSSGGTMLLPIQVLGRRHLVMTYPQDQTPALMATDHSLGGAGRLLVVATEPDTDVTLQVNKKASLVIAGLLPTVFAGESRTFPIGDGEVLQAWSGDDAQDLSGTQVFATKPVAVFSGNISTTYGRISSKVNSPDMTHEQMPPVAHWSFKYVAAGLPPQPDTCDTLLGRKGASLWRLLAAVDDTDVEFVGPEGVPPVHDDITMRAGDVIEFIADTDFVVIATNAPVLLTQGIDCEPSLSLAISADKLLEDVTFSVLPSFDQVVAIARKTGDVVLRDGVPVDDSLFTPAGGGYEVARVPLPVCLPGEQVCTHRLQGKFGMTLRGMDILASYALTAPSWFGCNDPVVLTCVN